MNINNKITDVAKGLADFLASKNMIKTPKPNSPALNMTQELKSKDKK